MKRGWREKLKERWWVFKDRMRAARKQKRRQAEIQRLSVEAQVMQDQQAHRIAGQPYVRPYRKAIAFNRDGGHRVPIQKRRHILLSSETAAAPTHPSAPIHEA